MNSEEKLVKFAGETVPVSEVNQRFVASLESASEDGGLAKVASDMATAYLRNYLPGQEELTKSAAEGGSNMIKTIMYEDGFARKVLPVKSVGEGEISKDLGGGFEGSDRPVILVDIQPTDYPAASMPLHSANDIKYYWGSKAQVGFYRIETVHRQKSKYELMTYRYDLRKMVTDTDAKMMQKQEDSDLISGVDEICEMYNNLNVFEFNGGLTRDVLAEVTKIWAKKMLPSGLCLANKATLAEVAKQNRNDIGGDLAEKAFVEGPDAILDKGIMGMKFLQTVKGDIVNDNVLYFFTQPDYLGGMYELDKPTMYIERKREMITSYITEVIGMGIINVAGVHKVKLNMGIDAYWNTIGGKKVAKNESYPVVKPVASAK